MHTIVLATTNQGKVKEFSHYLNPLNFNIQPNHELPEVEETGSTFIENAILKAKSASSFCNIPALADDSGLVVPALNGEPGIFSARYAGKNASSKANVSKLLDALDKISDRRAYFYCAIAYLDSTENPCPIIATGKWEGFITQSPAGLDGFGYDPIFFVPSHNKTAAELSIDIKNSISHRALALNCLMNKLKDEISHD